MNMQQWVTQLVQSIINSYEQVAIASVKNFKEFLRTTTLKVKVSNPTEKMQVEGSVEVSNQKDLEKQVKDLALAFRELKSSFKALRTVSVSNWQQFPKFPRFPMFPKEMRISNPVDKVSVSNLTDLEKKIDEVVQSLNKIEFKPEIKVSPTPVTVEAPNVNVPKQDPPVVNVEAPDLSKVTEIIEFLNSIGAKNPLAVQLSDGKKFYKALEKMGEIYAGSSFSAFQDVDGNGNAMGQLNRNSEVLVTTSETWSLNNTHRVTPYTYLGQETIDGRWMVQRIEKDGDYNIMRYATVKNNAGLSYDQAWTDHETLEFGKVSEAL